ncbi:putative heterokaryon incompatibility protein [Botrytis fragariae]|uniref:Putative heterokaryon incompatibility protein n=1 Tax=Botrytis fragariae TaxID=1964551 RepID=A0A8H6EJP9_9HELO|nr:putative heterokaryon incompatibility protein [Botrytis fragariae]KAF5874771.1 putative heterokaryon incompatibility protein [Botrytis fragariae]
MDFIGFPKRNYVTDRPFIYTVLPSPTSIRLLEIKSKLWCRTQYSLHVVELIEAPTFDVVSHSRRDLVPRNHIVLCDNKILRICGDAENSIKTGRKVASKSSGKMKTRYIWIDSVCINSEDAMDRTAQILMVPKTLKEARNVIIGLGKKIHFTSDAFKALKTLSLVPHDEWSNLVSLDWDCQEQYFQSLNIVPLQLQSWLSLIAFFNRPWFSGIWAVQEVTTGNDVVVACGKEIIPWETISKALSFLTHTEWYKELHTNRLIKFPGNSLKGRRHKKHQMLFNSETGFKMAVIQLESTRAGSESTQLLPLFRYLFRAHQYCEAPDKRDIIYALLGLSREDSLPFTKFPDALSINYQMAARDVYTNVARVLLQCHGLGISSDAQDSIASVPNLPTWVPDYSVPRGPLSLSMRGDCNWSACGDLKWKQKFLETEPNSLILQGMLLDTICEKVKEQNKSLHSMEFLNGIYEVTAHLDPIYPLAMGGNRFQSPHEVVWRTILADTYQNEHPAPQQCEELVANYQEWVRNGKQPRNYGKEEISCLEEEIEAANDARTLFRTLKGYLGIGAQSLCPSDEVWVLAGASVPLIVRRGEDGFYELVGEAYLHGVMHGEALEWGLKIRNVLLE